MIGAGNRTEPDESVLVIGSGHEKTGFNRTEPVFIYLIKFFILILYVKKKQAK